MPDQAPSGSGRQSRNPDTEDRGTSSKDLPEGRRKQQQRPQGGGGGSKSGGGGTKKGGKEER